MKHNTTNFSILTTLTLVALLAACSETIPLGVSSSPEMIVDQPSDELNQEPSEPSSPDDHSQPHEEADLDLPAADAEPEHPCSADQAWHGGGCVDPAGSIEDYLSQAIERPASYWWMVQVPTLLPDRESCCFDYGGNNGFGADNGLGDLLPIAENLAGLGARELQRILDDYFDLGMVTLVVDWTSLPQTSDKLLTDGEATLSIFIASHASDESWNDQLAGLGSYLVDSSSFGQFGAEIQFNNATIEGGVLRAGPSTVSLTIPAAPGLLESDFTVTIEQAQLEAPIVLEPTGVHTIDELRGGPGEEYLVGGGRFGGVIPADQIFAFVNDTMAACTCAGVSEGDQLLSYGQSPEGYQVSCNQEAFDSRISICCPPGVNSSSCSDGVPGVDCCEASSLCAHLPTICSLSDLYTTVLDVDLDGDGVLDGLSLGLRFAWTGAELIGYDQ